MEVEVEAPAVNEDNKQLPNDDDNVVMNDLNLPPNNYSRHASKTYLALAAFVLLL